MPAGTENKIETVIGSSVSLTGSLKAEGTIRIDGLFEGEIETAADVVIGRSGKVLANIKAQNVLVAGAVKGNITAVARLEIVSTGRVWGDIDVAALFVEEGGVFHGNSQMHGEGDTASPSGLLPSGPR